MNWFPVLFSLFIFINGSSESLSPCLILKSDHEFLQKLERPQNFINIMELAFAFEVSVPITTNNLQWMTNRKYDSPIIVKMKNRKFFIILKNITSRLVMRYANRVSNISSLKCIDKNLTNSFYVLKPGTDNFPLNENLLDTILHTCMIRFTRNSTNITYGYGDLMITNNYTYRKQMQFNASRYQFDIKEKFYNQCFCEKLVYYFRKCVTDEKHQNFIFSYILTGLFLFWIVFTIFYNLKPIFFVHNRIATHHIEQL